MKNVKCQHKQMCELALRRGTAVKWHRCNACPVQDRGGQPVSEGQRRDTPNFMKKRIVK